MIKCCSFSPTCTAWDSEIESLTSLIKLHQNERRSAPCGQIGAATQPPVLATSPTLKKFELHERSKLDEFARAVMIRRVLSFTTFSFQSFLWKASRWEKTLTKHSQTPASTSLFLAKNKLAGVCECFVSLSFVSLGALHNPERSLNSRVLSTPASSNVLTTRRRSS